MRTNATLAAFWRHVATTPIDASRFMTLVMVGVFIVVANALVVRVVVSSHCAKTTVNGMFASLAVADLLRGAVSFPFMAVYIARPSGWPIGSVLCGLWNALDAGCATVSLYHFLAISVYRQRSLLTPFHEVDATHKTKVKRCLTLVWILPFVFWIAYYAVFGAEMAQRDSCWNNTSLLFVVLSSVSVYLVPILVAAALCVATRLAIDKQNATRRTQLLESRAAATSSRAMLSWQPPRLPRQRRGRDNKADRVLIVTTTAFFVCWIPMVSCWIRFHHDTAYPFLYTLAYSFYSLHAAFNPILLFCFSDDLRYSLRTLFCCDTDVHPDQAVV